MNDYTPRKGSAAEAAIEYLRKKGGAARSGEIAAAIGVEAKSLMASLAAAVEHGVLMACDVQVPGAPPQKEYRLSGGGKPAPWREPKPATLSPGPSPADGSGERKAARRRPAIVAMRPSAPASSADGRLARLGHPPGSGMRFGVFSDGTLEIVLTDGQRIEIAAPEARRLIEYLDRSLLREAP